MGVNNVLIDKVKSSFLNKFRSEPLMIFSPGRINLIGEHTDYNEGYVFPAAVNMGIVAALEKSNAENSTVYALDKAESYSISLHDLKPSNNGSWENYIIGVVAELQNRSIIIGNFNMVFAGDIPGGAGMSSSAALENSVVFGLNELFDLKLSKEAMILISQKAEHNYVGVKCGIMDQYASMFGIKDHALLLDCRTVRSASFKINFESYQLLLINTNVKHSLSESAYNDRRSVCESIASLLKVNALRDITEFDLESIKDEVTTDNYQKALYVIQENNRVIEASKAIKDSDLAKLGKLLYDSHAGLQYQYKVSCEELDFLVKKSKENRQVLGARMMGGGFGGCTINLIEKSAVEAFKTAISNDYKNEFGKDCSIYEIDLSDGTSIISS